VRVAVVAVLTSLAQVGPLVLVAVALVELHLLLELQILAVVVAAQTVTVVA
jgi:hypothetical protein